MNHIIALLPYKHFEETFISIINVIQKTKIDVTIAGNIKKEDIPQYPFIKDVIHIPSADMFVQNEKELYKILDAFYARKPFSAIINFFEEYVELAAKITKRYGLNGNSERTAKLTRDKYEMRKELLKNNIRVPQFIKVNSYAPFLKAIDIVGLPCIAKPTDAMASEGVLKIENTDNLESIYANMIRANKEIVKSDHNELLVEEYIDGPEVSVEGVVSNGELKIMGITEKTTEEEPFFNEIMHIHPAPLEEEIEREIYTMTEKAVKALNIQFGGVHLEARLSKKGPTIIEIASRLGGDAIPSLVSLSKGYDPYHYVFKSGLNLPVALNKTRDKYAGIRFIQTNHEGILKEISFDDNELYKIPGIISKRIFGRIGEFIARPPKGRTNRLAYVTVAGRSYDKVKENLLKIESCLKFKIE